MIQKVLKMTFLTQFGFNKKDGKTAFVKISAVSGTREKYINCTLLDETIK